MKFKTKNSITSSQRHLVQLNTNYLNDKPLIKKKLKKLSNTGGKNNSGKITIRHKGGGHKQRYREINFNRNKISIGIVTSIEYDPNRNAHIAAIYDISTKDFLYILAPKNLKIGDIVKSGPNAEPKIGHSLPLSNIPVGSYIHNISTRIGKSAQITRSAGTYSKLKEKKLDFVKIELSSGEQRLVPSNCYATIGIVSNDLLFLTQQGKAGRSRWLNKRPTVRGVAMNPVDHPHGGGEGKKSGIGKTPWGKYTKKGSTSKSKNKLIIKRRTING
jgi:large subunit ribosomal protein L2